MNDGETSHTVQRSAGEDEGGSPCAISLSKWKRTSERVVVARAHYRSPPRVPVCCSDGLAVLTFGTQRRGTTTLCLVKLLNVLEPKLKKAMAWGLIARV